MLKSKIIFISGGVISAVGKGVTSASISLLLKSRGFSVFPIKFENNLNVDFGTVNPIEHGDPFLCADGCEADQDLGNYERFLNQTVGWDNFKTMGGFYLDVINRERRMGYNGEDVEPIPHVVNEIVSFVENKAEKSMADFIVIELGGTVGEYENNNGLYYEAARVLASKYKVCHVHVTYVPVPAHIGEPKTKPAQFGIKALMSMGILPDFIIVRSEKELDEQRKYKFALKFNIDEKHIFSNENLDSIYDIPLHLHKQKLDERILKFFRIKRKDINLAKWKNFCTNYSKNHKSSVKIAIVGKYFGTGKSILLDSYLALIEALKHAAVFNKQNLKLKFVNSEKEEANIKNILNDVDGIIVPIGWGKRGVPGMLKAISFARKNKIPYLGLCYGMQLAAIEFARNVCKIEDADTQENNPKSKNLIIHSIPFDPKYQVIKGDGCSMRLGTYPCILKKNSLVFSIYSKHNALKNKKEGIVEERHRHRFEFNNVFRKKLESEGLIISGVSPDNFFVEFIELSKKSHPFFVGTQGHPEYKSRPLKPHPIFIEFLIAAENKKKNYNSSK